MSGRLLLAPLTVEESVQDVVHAFAENPRCLPLSPLLDEGGALSGLAHGLVRGDRFQAKSVQSAHPEAVDAGDAQRVRPEPAPRAAGTSEMPRCALPLWASMRYKPIVPTGPAVESSRP